MTTEQPGVHGVPPLTGRLEPWMRRLLDDPVATAAVVEQFGSPVNVHEPSILARNAAELVDAGARHDIEVRVFFARKANKTIGLLDAARDAGVGVDVASLAELRQALDRGVPASRIIVSAAVKSDALLGLAVESGACVSVDHVAELHRLSALAGSRPVPVAPRLALEPREGLAPTRFGERAGRWLETFSQFVPGVRLVGIHLHLNGYDAAERAEAVAQACELADALRERGHAPEFLDLGGGVPMSYLDDQSQWDAFWHAMGPAYGEQLTWKDDPLANVYPYWQASTRGAWLDTLLGLRPRGDRTCAELLQQAQLRLHLEPGRALADGCGMTLARVEFVKERSDGVPLVGLAMNRTQCRSTSDDFLVDPVLVRTQALGAPLSAFLVGAYCIEDELILRRRMYFPHGVARGDVIALINTGGYLMHILESASHQLPLARNVVWDAETGAMLDLIDG